MKTKLSLLVLSFASILFAQTGVPSGAPTADLLGYYPFESNPTNAAGSDYNLVVVSDDTPGQIWTSVGYMEDGAVGGFIDIQKNAGLISANNDFSTYFDNATSPEFTFSFFMKQGLSAENSVPMFGTFIEMFESFFFRGDLLTFGISTIDGDFSFENLSDFPISETWAHYAITFKENSGDSSVPQGLLSVYVNGVLEESMVTPTFNLEAYSNNLSIGTGYAGEDLNWAQKGVALGIDELYVYGRALTDAEVEDLYNLNELPDCPTGSVVLATQAEVDDFVSQYPNCTEIDGDLFVGNFAANPPVNDITDISGLNGIESVANTLGIFRTSLTTLAGFDNLTSVNSVQILNNPEITNITGFNNLIEAEGVVFGNNASLTEIAGFSSIESLNSLQIQGGHPVLNSVTGFSNLETIAGLFRIGDFTNQINDISGFSSLENVGLLYVVATQLTDLSILDGVTIEAETARLQIESNPLLTSLPNLNFVGPVTETIIFNNPLLTDLTGLESLTKSNVWIQNNAGLTSLNGLQGVQESNKWAGGGVDFGVRIINNGNLTDLDPLNNLEDLDDLNIQVTNNANLTDISGLDNVSISTINQLNVSGNTNLATCGSTLVCEYIYVNDNNGLTFSNNGAGCNSKEDAEANCADILEGLCPTGNLFLTTEAQINRFGEFYTNCTELENLTVIAPDETTDLSMFDSLVTVNGMLRIGTTNGTSLSGFHNVENVGFLWITSSPLMESLDVLGNVQGTVTKLEITNSTQLTTVSNFGTFELNDLEVRGNSSLTNLNFLNGVSLVAGEYFAFGPNGNTLGFYAPTVNITNNHSLTSLDGLSVPNSLFNLYLAGHQLNDLSLLNTLENLDHAFALFNTEEVENLDFLSGLTTFSVGEMYIGNNLGLENLDGLNGVMGNFDNTNFIEISENPNLATCESSFICAIVDEFEAGGGDGSALVETEPYEGSGGNILFIYDNAEGCNSIEEIEIACETFSTELFLTSDVSIYPNPFKNQLTIQLPEFAGTSKVSLVDVSGRIIVQQEISQLGQITGLDELAKGLYFVKITSEDGQSITQKLIK